MGTWGSGEVASSSAIEQPRMTSCLFDVWETSPFFFLPPPSLRKGKAHQGGKAYLVSALTDDDDNDDNDDNDVSRSPLRIN